MKRYSQADTSACNFPSLPIINAWAEKSTNIGIDVDMILNKLEVNGYTFKSDSATVFTPLEGNSFL